MPLYEYQCLKCSRIIEKIQKFSDRPLTRCGECGGKLERLISAPAIQFKGSGWYVTDYPRKSAPADKGKDGSSPQSAEKKGKEPAKTAESGKPTSSEK